MINTAVLSKFGANDIAVDKGRKTGVAVIALAFIWLLIALAVLDLAGISFMGLLIVSNATFLIFPLIWRAAAGSLDMFEPLLITNASLGGMMIGRPLADLVSGRFVEHGYSVFPAFSQALVVVALASLALQIGYFSPFPSIFALVLPRLSGSFHARSAALYALCLAIVGLTAYSVFLLGQGGIHFLILMLAGRSKSVTEGMFASSGYLYGALGFLTPAAIIFLGCWVRTRRPIYLVATLISGAPQLVIMGAQGSRSGMIGLLFAFPMVWFLSKNQRPSLIQIGIGAFILMAAFGFIRTHRDADTHGKSTQTSSDLVDSALSIFQSDDDEMFDVTALEVLNVPRFIPYHHFGVITDIIVRAVPRQLYPNKRVDISTEFFQAMWPGRAHATHSRGGAAPSLIGDFYMDSGIITVVFWMVVLGGILRTSWNWFLSNQSSMNALLIYAVVPATTIGLLRATFAGSIAAGLFSALPLLILPAVMKIRMR